MAEVDDEECGLPLNNGGANGGTAIRHHSSGSYSPRSRSDDSNPQRQSSNSSSHHSRQLSIQSNVSDSEYQDYVSELTPLVGVSEEMAPSPTSYDVNGVGGDSYPQHQMRHNLQRIPSEESIHTVTALPGMVIRCHSINMVVGSRDGSCAIRPSTTKVVRIKYSNFQC